MTELSFDASCFKFARFNKPMYFRCILLFNNNKEICELLGFNMLKFDLA